MKNTITPTKTIHLPLSKELIRNYSSRSHKITSNLNFKSVDNTAQKDNDKVNSNYPTKHINNISSLRNQLGNIKNQVTKLIQKYPNKNQNQTQNTNKTIKQNESRILNNYDTMQNLQLQKTTAKVKTSKRLFAQDDQNEKQLKRVTENLQRFKKELRQTLQRQSIIINEKGKLLQMMGVLQKEKNDAKSKLDKIQMQMNQIIAHQKKLQQDLSLQKKENKKMREELDAINREQNKRCDKIKNEYQKLDIRFSMCTKVNEQLKNELQILRLQLKLSSSQIKRNQLIINNNSIQIKSLQQKIVNLKQQLVNKKQKGTDHKYELFKHQIKQELKFKDKIIYNLNLDIKKLDKQIKILQQFKAQYHQYQQTLKNANQLIIKYNLLKLNQKYKYNQKLHN